MRCKTVSYLKMKLMMNLRNESGEASVGCNTVRALRLHESADF